MPIKFNCPHCGKSMDVADQYAGQSGPCAACGKPITIPGSAFVAPPLAPASGGSGGGTLIAILGVVAVFGFCGIGVLVALLLPAVQAAREAARRVQSTNNMKQIVLAMHMYHDTYNTFPPAVVTDGAGKPLYSGRVLLLPFLEEAALYNRWDKSKAWDSPENLPLADAALKVFVDPSSPNSTPGHTDYVFVTGQGTCFEGNRSVTIASITDGTSNTALVIEVKGGAGNWAEPREYDLAAGPPQVGNHPGGVIVAFADGTVRLVPKDALLENFPKLFTRADGMPVMIAP